MSAKKTETKAGPGRPAYSTRPAGGVFLPLTEKELKAIQAEAREEGRTPPQQIRIKLGLKPL